jgi:phage pi2 protein 07
MFLTGVIQDKQERKGDCYRMMGPDKNKLYPNETIKTVCYISNLPKRANVEIGDYTYYSDNKKSPEQFYDAIDLIILKTWRLRIILLS